MLSTVRATSGTIFHAWDLALKTIIPMRSPPPLWSPITKKIPIMIDPLERPLDKPLERPAIPISCPLSEQKEEILFTNRVKRQRWRHCRKKHRQQRLREMRHVIQKQQDDREAAKEAQFRKEMSVLLKSALEFDAEKYVRDTISRAKWKPTPDNTESLRSGVFWTEFMTVEELFGVPDGDYIDKKSGVAGDEDWKKILELREKYNREYKRKK